MRFSPWLACLCFITVQNLQAQILPLPSPNRTAVNSFVQVNSKFATHTTDPVSTPAFTNPLTNPSLIVVTICENGNATPATPTDTAGNSYVDSGAGSVQGDSGLVRTRIFYALNTHTTASNVVSVSNPSGGNNAYLVSAMEFTGGKTASPVRGFASQANIAATTSTDSITSTTISGTVAGDLIVGSVGTNATNTLSVGTGFTSSADPQHTGEYILSGPGGSVAATWTTSLNGLNYGAIAVAFKPGP